MVIFLVLWLTLGFLSFGIWGLNYVHTRRVAERPWRIRKQKDYSPKLSIIVPTYNEQEVIGYKLRNLAKLEYRKDLMEIVFVDSNSTDSTVSLIRTFAESCPSLCIKILIESQRKGKSSALNVALRSCTGEIIVVSDADCLLPPDIMSKALPYLADVRIGAISGPKKLLNPQGSSVTRSEDAYLKAMNLMKLGDSKKSSTILFEGGFSAYKAKVLSGFDPYKTGSDDCGTVLGLLEKGFRAIMIPEAEFFTTFPETWEEKTEMKIRRTKQLVRILRNYMVLLLKNEIKTAREVVARNLIIYLLAPITFFFFMVATLYLMLEFPATILLLLIFLVPKVRKYLVEAMLSYLILLFSTILILSRSNVTIWKTRRNRGLLSEEVLLSKGLI